jgi:ketosteroid isomerase-like protein
MSRENVDIIRELFERANSQDETLLDDFYDPDAVWHSRADEPDTGVYEGREAIRELWRMWLDMFEDFQLSPSEYIEAGDCVITPGWVEGRGRASGAPVRELYVWVTRLRDGKVIEVREYRDKAEALEAAGLG